MFSTGPTAMRGAVSRGVDGRESNSELDAVEVPDREGALRELALGAWRVGGSCKGSDADPSGEQ